MSDRATSVMPNLSAPGHFRSRAAHGVRHVMEGLLLLLVVLSPWAFGCVHPSFEFFLDAGVALLMLLWAVNILLAGKRPWEFCPATLCLAGLLLVGLWQLVPFSRPALEWVSPGTAAWYIRLLPEAPERLPDGAAEEASAAGKTISFDPGATRAEVLRLLAVFAVFMLVRQNLASAAALRRLSVVALANGAALALFALVQFWTSRSHTVYWTFPTIAAGIGPFINHNHAAGYFNLCLGLGVGLLLARSRRADGRAGANWWLDPGVLWLLLPLTILLVGVAFSLSRGGLLSFFGAVAVTVAMAVARGRWGRLMGGLLVMVALAFAILSWFGLAPLLDRFNTAWEHGDPSRIAVWLRVLPLMGEFPLWGTGYGTFGSIEATQRIDAGEFGLSFTHAHNEYVQALLEGGFPRLSLTLGFIFLVGRAAFRIIVRAPDSLGADLASGGLFAIAALVLHSFVEFGIHIPALTLLATVLSAHLIGMAPSSQADTSTTTSTTEVIPSEEVRQAGVVTRAVAALFVIGVAFVIGAEGWKAYRVDGLRRSAEASAAVDAVRISRLEAGVRLAPDLGLLHLELAQAHLNALREHKKEIVRRALAREAAQTVAAFAVGQGTHPAFFQAPGLLATMQYRDRLLQADPEVLRVHLAPALRHLIRARDANPLMPGPHLQLAMHTHELTRADSIFAYLGRAKFLAPGDPEVWYFCGIQELALLEPRRACADWQHSLELSNRHLNDVLKLSATIFTPAMIRTQILAAKPDQLLLAALQLFPKDEQKSARRPFLEQALALLEQQPPPRTAENCQVEARIQASLGEPDKALAAYQLALSQEPHKVEWRWEFAQLLYQQKHLAETRLELLTILRYQPGHAPARALLPVVAKEIEAKR